MLAGDILAGFAPTVVWIAGAMTNLGNLVRRAGSFGRLAPVSGIPVGFAPTAAWIAGVFTPVSFMTTSVWNVYSIITMRKLDLLAENFGRLTAMPHLAA